MQNEITLEETIKALCERYKIPHNQIFGHKEMKGHESNECPGREILEVVKIERTKSD